MAKAATIKKPPKSLLVIHDVEQGTDAWFRVRMGIPTASNFATVMASGSNGDKSMTRTEYMYRLAGEIITERPAEETFKSRAMERGKEMEGEAIADYEKRKSAEVRRIGFATNFEGLRKCGASPDGLVGFDGGLETKTMRPDLMIPLLDRGARMPPEHRAQVQGNMHVLERDLWDFKIYYPRMPDFTVRVFRDDLYIKELDNQIQIFNHETKRLVEKLRSMGAA
jgi:YqaJ-like viral recombinase domain